MLFIFGAIPALASDQVVTSTDDSYAAGTLRYAIGNATSGSDTITFNLTTPATITLTMDELQLYYGVTITGPGASNLTIDGGGNFRVFEDDAYGATVNISGLTIAHGAGKVLSTDYGTYLNGLGGGILNSSGTMTLTDVTISNNSATEGGGISNSGTMTLTNCTVSDNSAATGSSTPLGGGIFNYGRLTITGSTISNNTASGADIDSDPPSDGAAGGGGIATFFSDVIYDPGILTVINSTISNNSADSEGGGIDNNNGTITITNSTISGNNATGGIYQYGYLTGDTYVGQAGGIENDGVATITGSTISGNISSGSAGGILNNDGETLTMVNSTVSGNTAVYAAGGILNSGYTNHFGNMSLSFVTISGNQGDSKGYGFFFGDGIVNQGTAALKNTIIANSPEQYNCYVYPGSPAIVSRGYNISDDTSCAAYFNKVVDKNNTPALLDSGLNNNGGPTQTIALLPGSPAILNVPRANCKDVAGNTVTTDQRGVTRPQGTACSTGAFEFAPPKLLVTSSFGSRVGGTVPAQVTITNSGDAPATNVQLTRARIGATGNTTTSLPLTVGTGTIAADGGSGQASVSFSGVASGANILTIDGTYFGGSFASTARVTVP